MKFIYSKEIKEFIAHSKPVLALESTIISQGMPYPDNLEFAKNSEDLCRKNGVAPGIVAIFNGKIHIGLNKKKLNLITQYKNVKKISKREIGIAITKKWTGATTASATMQIAHQANIPVFATGGIGGVHKNGDRSFDISEDLSALSKTPMIVISAGAKAILDIPKTVEVLESHGVTTLGFKTNTFPAFYSRLSNINNLISVADEKEIIKVFLSNKRSGLSSSTFVVNPIPKKDEIPYYKINKIIDKAVIEAERQSISGKQITPFLLQYIVEATDGNSLRANKALALNNIRLGINVSRKLLNTIKTTL